MGNPHRGADGRFTTKVSKQAAQVAKATKPFGELGVATRQRMGSTLYDDYLPQLRGQRAARTYREMSEGDATLGGILYAIEQSIRRLDWPVVPADDTPAAQEAADFVTGCKTDMATDWDEFIAAAISMLPYGFSVFEQVWKRRTDKTSNYNDGKIGWAKMAFRPQDTIVEWTYDDDGMVIGVVQEPNVRIPIDKALVFRTQQRGDPSGKSILRTAYAAWYQAKRATEIMLIGLERDLTGLPVMRIPAESIISGDAVYTEAQNIVRRVKVDEQAGMVLPSDRDESGGYLYEFQLVSSPGSAKVDPLPIISSLKTDMAATVLADFIRLGHDAVGSRALAEPKIDLFQQSLETFADIIANELNRQALPALWKLNNLPRQTMPSITHGDIRDVTLAEFASALKDTAQAGFPWDFDAPDVAGRVRQKLGLAPEMSSDLEKVRWHRG